MNTPQMNEICKVLRYYIIKSSSEAGSGHPTSSLSATELMATLFFGGYFKYNLDNPDDIANDRVIFSKGHASPLFYSLYKVAGAISEKEIMDYRKITSDLEGHPTPRFRYTEASTGSLGQGLSVGLGIALGIKMKFGHKPTSTVNHEIKDINSLGYTGKNNSKSDNHDLPKVYVLLGDSEMAEGQVWEAIEIASHYKVDNLVGIIDVNRLGQRGETMQGWDILPFKQRLEAFGWNTIVVEDGHSLSEVNRAFEAITGKNNDIYNLKSGRPTMIIARTKKGHGISFLENKDDWHGKAVPKDMAEQAYREIGAKDTSIIAEVAKPKPAALPKTEPTGASPMQPDYSKPAATREAYGDALVALGSRFPNLVVLDAETSNSTYADKFKKAYPERFFEMYIAEQNMVSVAVGLARMGYVPFVSSFAAFLARAFDQIRMAQYSEANLKVVGSHAGVSIGYDGSSQMALEDLGMMKGILEGTVLYPSDAVSTTKLVETLYNKHGIGYLRLTREKTNALYKNDEQFPIGGSKVLKESDKDTAVIFAAGITVHEALKAYEELQKNGTSVAIVDLYSLKPADTTTINRLAKKTGRVIVVEDHYPNGGLADTVREAIFTAGRANSMLIPSFTHLCAREIPHSGAPAELLKLEGIDAAAIVTAVKKIA